MHCMSNAATAVETLPMEVKRPAIPCQAQRLQYHVNPSLDGMVRTLLAAIQSWILWIEAILSRRNKESPVASETTRHIRSRRDEPRFHSF